VSHDRKMVRNGMDRYRPKLAAQLAFARHPRWRTEYRPRMTFGEHWGDVEDVNAGDWDEDRKP
jgi:hypothetical protein